MDLQQAHSLLRNQLPMTDFRHVCGLPTYSGGTVPDSNRIPYSPLNLNDFSSTYTTFSVQLIILTAKDFVNKHAKTTDVFGNMH